MNNRVIHIQHRRPKAAVKALNRITGLVWDSYPHSLLEYVAQWDTRNTQPYAHLPRAAQARSRQAKSGWERSV